MSQTKNKRSLYIKRTSFKPFEFSEIEEYKKAINHSFWLFSEWNFAADVQDFHTKLTPLHKNCFKRAVLAISQIEVSVKSFWGDLGKRFPKPEISQVGMTFAESEVRHADAYSHILEVLGLNNEFELLLEEPVIQGRVDYLTKYLKGASDSSDENYALTLTLFSLFIENVSLFSQFAIIKSFNKHLNVLKDIDNVVQATQQEEQLHGQLGALLINLIREERPEWFGDKFCEKVARACKKAFISECAIIDWIFQEGELEFLSSESLKEFIKSRFNQSVEMIGCSAIFEIDKDKLAPLKWFREELLTEVNIDFFHKKSTDYSKNTQPITEDDLF